MRDAKDPGPGAGGPRRLELETLERQVWQALSAEGRAAAFSERYLDDDVVMLPPGGLRLVGRGQALPAMGGPPWDSYRLEDLHVGRPTPDTGLVTYSAVAARG